MSGGGAGGPVNPTRCKEKPWDLWVSEIGRESPRRDSPADPKESPRRRRSGVSLLRYSSMSLHGQFPQTDNLNAVVCHMCGATVKCAGAYRHLATYHSAVVEPALPPPPAPTVRLKSSHSRSKHKKEPPPPPELEPPPEPPRAPPTAAVYYAEEELQGAAVAVQVAVPVVGGEVQVCVDGELPVVSIQDPEELPLGENITDDIFAIMNSEGIQSAEDPDSTAAWKNIIRDISTLQDMSFQQPDGSEYTSADVIAAPAYSLADELSAVQYAPAPSLAVPALPTVLDAVALNPTPASSKSRPKSSKSKYNSREYDPNKHCGVITAETHKPCTRSLTCKAHTLSLRRTVEGRVKPFDTLLTEHKAAREASVVAALPPPQHSPAPLTLSIPPALLVNTSIDLSTFNSLATDQQVTDIYTSLLGAEEHAVLPDTSSITSLLSHALPADQFLLSEDPELCGEVPILSIASPTEVIQPPPPPPPAPAPPAPKPESEGPPALVPSDVCWYAAAPRPLALCTFNASHAGGAVVLGRKFATVRSNIKSSLSRSQGKVASGSNSYYNFSQNSMTSLSKTVHLNNAKCSKPELRRLIVPTASVKCEYGEGDYSRHNGHIAGASGKRSAAVADECESKRPHMLRAGRGVKVGRHTTHTHTHAPHAHTHTQPDMLELTFMLDPLIAEEKC